MFDPCACEIKEGYKILVANNKTKMTEAKPVLPTLAPSPLRFNVVGIGCQKERKCQ